MNRYLDGVLVLVAVAGAVWTYQIKHETESSARRIKSLKVQIAAQNRKIDLLEADWAIETGPARLESLATRFADQLGLQHMQSSQIATIEELPEIRQQPTSEETETFADNNDGTVTGSIGDLLNREGSD